MHGIAPVQTSTIYICRKIAQIASTAIPIEVTMEMKVYSENNPCPSTMHSARRPCIFYLQGDKMQVTFLPAQIAVCQDSFSEIGLHLNSYSSLGSQGPVTLARLYRAPQDSECGFWDPWKSQECISKVKQQTSVFPA